MNVVPSQWIQMWISRGTDRIFFRQPHSHPPTNRWLVATDTLASILSINEMDQSCTPPAEGCSSKGSVGGAHSSCECDNLWTQLEDSSEECWTSVPALPSVSQRSSPTLRTLQRTSPPPRCAPTGLACTPIACQSPSNPPQSWPSRYRHTLVAPSPSDGLHKSIPKTCACLHSPRDSMPTVDDYPLFRTDYGRFFQATLRVSHRSSILVCGRQSHAVTLGVGMVQNHGKKNPST